MQLEVYNKYLIEIEWCWYLQWQHISKPCNKSKSGVKYYSYWHSSYRNNFLFNHKEIAFDIWFIVNNSNDLWMKICSVDMLCGLSWIFCNLTRRNVSIAQLIGLKCIYLELTPVKMMNFLTVASKMLARFMNSRIKARKYPISSLNIARQQSRADTLTFIRTFFQIFGQTSIRVFLFSDSFRISKSSKTLKNNCN